MKYAIIILVFIGASSAKAQCRFEITITELSSDNGKVMLELFDSQNKKIDGRQASIKNRVATIVFENIKPGKYAARYFHDENNNNDLDMNFMGIPKEGYGFTNDAYGMFGPKPFDKWLVDVSGTTRVQLKTKN